MPQRFSKKREAIYNAIRSVKSHPSAEWVYEKLKPQFPDLSLATVYRNIAQFRDEGLLREVGVVDSRQHYDADLSPHAHLICTACGAVTDIPVTLPDNGFPRETDGAVIESAEITFRGLCKNCVSARFDKK